MKTDGFHKSIMQRILESADVRTDGKRPWDIQIRNENFFARVFTQGPLGLGESYMDGWWDCEHLDEFFYRALRAELDTQVASGLGLWERLKARFFNFQTPSRAFLIGKRHYDIGNDLYQSMLGNRLIYSCGFWEHASSLDEAQEAKLELICRKLNIRPGMRILDIGCGWGGTAKYIAEHCRADVLGITVSEEQAVYAKHLCEGLPVQIRLLDYRNADGVFDRIVCVGMFEHVGPKNYATFMDVARRCLKKDGLLLLHTIGSQHTCACSDPWITRYIFPNSKLPSARQICDAIGNRFVLEDWQNLGVHYDRTLMQWYRNFQDNWSSLCDHYDERFFRMWKYYLLSCAGSFRARTNQLWQIVLSPRGVLGGYRIAREPREAQGPQDTAGAVNVPQKRAEPVDAERVRTSSSA